MKRLVLLFLLVDAVGCGSFAAAPATTAHAAGSRGYGTPMEAITARIHYPYNDGLGGLIDDAIEAIRLKASALQEFPDIRLRVEGHTDERGAWEDNQALGRRMAQEAMDYLVSFGVDARRLDGPWGFGEEMPLDRRSSESAWRLNRRVEFVIIAGGPL